MSPQLTQQPCRCPQAKQDLQELLNDPIVHLVMERDGVTVDDITDLFTAVRKRLLAKRWRDAA